MIYCSGIAWKNKAIAAIIIVVGVGVVVVVIFTIIFITQCYQSSDNYQNPSNLSINIHIPGNVKYTGM